METASLNTSIRALSSKGSFETDRTPIGDRSSLPHYEAVDSMGMNHHIDDTANVYAPPTTVVQDANGQAEQQVDQRELVDYGSKTARTTRILLWTFLAVLMIDAILEMAFSSLTVDSLITLTYSRRTFAVQGVSDTYNGATAYLSAVPTSLDHISTALALSSGSTALVLVGFGGILALCLRDKRNYSNSLYSKIWYHFWLVCVLLSTVLCLATFIYTFGIMSNSNGMGGIDKSALPTVNTTYVRYSIGSWDPLTWFQAMFDVGFKNMDEADDMWHRYQWIRIYVFNIIPFFVFHLVVLFFTVVDGVLARNAARQSRAKINEKEAEISA